MFRGHFHVTISTLSGPIDEENTYSPLPKYYFFIKTGLENGPKKIVHSPIVQSIGPVYNLLNTL